MLGKGGLISFLSAPFLALTSVMLCDILGLESLTNAYGIVSLIRGISSTIGSPVAGK